MKFALLFLPPLGLTPLFMMYGEFLNICWKVNAWRAALPLMCLENLLFLNLYMSFKVMMKKKCLYLLLNEEPVSRDHKDRKDKLKG